MFTLTASYSLTHWIVVGIARLETQFSLEQEKTFLL